MAFSTLWQLRHSIQHNGRELCLQFPDVEAAAELVNQALWALTHHRVHLDIPKSGPSFGAAENLAFGAHQSWMKSVVLASAGQADTGFSEARRAAEYVCFTAKIIGNDERLKLWTERGEGKKARQRFNGVFGIPHAYVSADYKFLRAMLVLHEEASEQGTHGNFRVLQNNWIETESGERRWGYQVPADQVVTTTGVMVLYGLRILYALRQVLDAHLRNKDTLDGQIQAAGDRVRMMCQERLGEEAADVANEESPVLTDLFRQLLEKEEIPFPADLNHSDEEE